MSLMSPGMRSPDIDSPGGGSSGIGLIEEPAESLDGSDFDDSLSDLGD